MKERVEHTTQPHRLPRQLTPFIGRRQELGDMLRLLADPECRLLTLVGPGGIGKTRLAIRAAAAQLEGPNAALLPEEHVSLIGRKSFADGVFFIALQPLHTTRHIPSTMADALGLALSGLDEPLAQLLHYLADKEMLLILDNFEHLMAGAVIASDILQAAPQVTLMVTSREPLGLQEECLYPIGGMPVPPAAHVGELNAYDAVQLFVGRARRVQPEFSLPDEKDGVIRICQLVEGMPLAIELAASWTRTLRCTEIANEIERSIGFLSTSLRNVPERHRNVQAVFDGSWTMLGAEEQAVFERLSVFRSGFGRRAAEQVAGASLPILSTLVDKSLLRWTPDGRYQIHELLRQCAEDKLAQSKENLRLARGAHCAHYAGFLQERFRDLAAGRQVAALAEVAVELDNVRAAWLWAIDNGKVAEIAQAVGAISLFHQMRGRYMEGMAALEEAERRLVEMPQDAETARALLALHLELVYFCVRLGRLDDAEIKARQSREIYQHLDIPPISGDGTDPALGLGLIASVRGDYQAVARYGEAARQASEAHGHQSNLTIAHYLLARAALAQGLLDLAREHALQAYNMTRQSNNRWFMTYCLHTLGDIAFAQADYDTARRHFEAGYAIRQGFEDPIGMAEGLVRLGEIAIRQEEYQQARELFQQSNDIYQETGDRGGIATALGGLADAQVHLGNHAAARRLFLDALALAIEIRFVSLVPALMVGIGVLLAQTGRQEQGLELLAIVAHDPTSEYETKSRAQHWLTRLRGSTAPEDLRPMFPSSGQQDLLTMAATLQTELSVHDLESHLERPDAETKDIPPVQPMVEPLTPRELEVLQLIAQGLTNQQIADRLIISVGTVKYYSSHIYGKLGVTSRILAVACARELGLID